MHILVHVVLHNQLLPHCAPVARAQPHVSINFVVVSGWTKLEYFEKLNGLFDDVMECVSF